MNQKHPVRWPAIFSIPVFFLGVLAVPDLLRGQGNYATPYVITTLAGSAQQSGSADGIGNSARFNYPEGVAVDLAGNVYVADSGNGTIRKITSSAVVTTIAGVARSFGSTDGTSNARFSTPAGVAVDPSGSILYVADSGNHTIRKITSGGVVSTFAGNSASVTSYADGIGSAAAFGGPTGVALDPTGNLYVADFGNDIIRKITPAGVVSTLAGLAGSAGGFVVVDSSADGTGGAARFNQATGVATDGSGNVYVADQGNHTIRKISPSGVVTTIAGSAGNSGYADGAGSAARFYLPSCVAVDSANNIYVGEYGSHTIRKITPSGTVTTLAGNYNSSARSADGVGSAAIFGGIYGIAVDSSGTIYIADAANMTIRKGTLASVSSPIQTQPQSQAVSTGATATLSVVASAGGSATYQWQLNGGTLTGATSATLSVPNLQPANTGLYAAVVTSGATASASDAAIVGVTTTSKVIGAGAEIAHGVFVASNGNTFDQVLPSGAAVAVTAEPLKITRTSFVDLTNDIVQVEFSGAGTLSLVLDNPSGPALPVNYNQSTLYMKGHVGIVITGADETTNFSIFSVGKITAVNQALFKSDVTYDGVADVAFVAISTTNGKFGGFRASNASFYATKGLTGVYAPGVVFQGPVFVGDINASDAATPVLMIGSSPDTRITGGDLLQTNGQPVKVSGLTQLKFTAGTTSHGGNLPAQTNKAVLQQNGVDVTAQIVLNPN